MAEYKCAGGCGRTIIDPETRPSEPHWVVARETAVDWPGERPKLAYTILADAPTFPDAEAASAYIKANRLPIGWVRMEVSRAPWSALASAPAAAPLPMTDERIAEPGWSYLPISGRWRCPGCGRELQEAGKSGLGGAKYIFLGRKDDR